MWNSRSDGSAGLYILLVWDIFSRNEGHPWYKIPDRQIHYELSVGDDINPQEWIENQSIPMASRRLTKHLEDYFNSQTSQKGSQ